MPQHRRRNRIIVLVEIISLINEYLFVHDAIQHCNAIQYDKRHQMNGEVDINGNHETVLIWSCHADQQTHHGQFHGIFIT